MAEFYSARSSTMPPLPWPTFAPPLSERRFISERTRAALAATRAKGTKLGGVQERTQERIDQFTQDVMRHIQMLNDAGITKVSAIATALNERGIRTSKGTLWGATQVRRVMERNPT